MYNRFLSRLSRVRTLAIAGLVVSVAGMGALLASDHQDTPEVELNQRLDINDVYAFPGGNGTSTDRIVLAITTASPIVGQQLSFDPSILYQIKVDNTGDAKEDLVFQVTFDQGSGSSQSFTVVGPVAPTSAGSTTGTPATGGIINKRFTSGSSVTGTVGTTAGSSTGIQVFAGLREDPFFIDLDQFFKIVPDRRPATGPLSVPLTQTATSFRNPGVDFLGSIKANALAIVIELPKAQLQSSTATGAKIGVWATISK